MRSLLSFVALLFVAVVSAISTTGDRLLVVLDEVAEKDGYSKFLGDLESMFTTRTWLPIAMLINWRCRQRVQAVDPDAEERVVGAIPSRRAGV